MLLTREDQRALDATYRELRKMSSDVRISKYDAEMRLQKHKQRSHPTPRKSTLELRLEAELRQRREERRKEAERMMSHSTKSYSTKAKFDNNAIESCYALKKKLPLAAQKKFMDEYNGTPYGLEQQLVDKYRRLYRL